MTRREAQKLQPLVDEIRAAGGQAHGFGSDARKEEEVAELVETIERDIGPIEAFVFNIGANVPCSILEETPRKYFKIWEMACFAGFLTAQAVARRMVTRERGTILFTGATAGTRGAAGFAAFAGAKHGLRALAQSMARELGPRNIHVGHVVVDGAIDTAFIRDSFLNVMRSRTRTASSILHTSPTVTGSCTRNHVMPGPLNWTCARGWSAGKSHPHTRIES